MKTTDIVTRAGRNLRRAKMRTILTSVAIAVGGFAAPSDKTVVIIGHFDTVGISD